MSSAASWSCTVATASRRVAAAAAARSTCWRAGRELRRGVGEVVARVLVLRDAPREERDAGEREHERDAERQIQRRQPGDRLSHSPPPAGRRWRVRRLGRGAHRRVFASRSASAASPAPWNAAARSVVCALLYWSTAWLATSTAWLLASTWACSAAKSAASASLVARALAAEQPESPLRVLFGGREVAHLPVHRLGARLHVVGVVAHDERGARGAERDDEEDHGGDEQRGALPTVRRQAAGARGSRTGRVSGHAPE